MVTRPGNRGGIMIGQTISHYQITDEIGRGGMGEVFRARDVRLGRSVALKFLATDIAGDPDLLRRFRREARVLASLAHPGIAVIHDIDETAGRAFLVLELVAGQSLASRLRQGPFAWREALGIAAQVCAALEAAHGQGVIHRDLKPANLMLQPDGQAKILDFGIARTHREDATLSTRTVDPAADSLVTGSGVLLGTASYMSPEQSRGEVVDQRTDIWALGCVIFECLCGVQAFSGPSIVAIVQAIREMDPPWEILPAGTPDSVVRILRRCLGKQPRERYHAIADVRLDIEEALASEGADEPQSRGSRSRRWWWLAAAIPSVMIGLGLGWFLRSQGVASSPAATRPTQFTVSVEETGSVMGRKGRPLAVSQDGRHLACVVERDHVPRINLWDLARATMRPLPGTEGAANPFFSPDGAWLGFFADDQLKRLRLADGAVQVLCGVVAPQGAFWGEDGTIVLSCGADPTVQRVSEAGGIPRPLTAQTASESSTWHVWPAGVPGSELVMTTLTSGLYYETSAIAVIDPATGESRVVLENAAWPTVTRDGNLLFVRDGALQLVAFDARHGRVTGEAMILTEILASDVSEWTPTYAYAVGGTIVWLPAESTRPLWQDERSVVAVDTTGTVTTLGIPAGPYTMPSLSPDGQKLALTVFREHNIENWIWDLRRQTFTKLPPLFNDHIPVWSPSGDRLAVSAAGTAGGTPNIFLVPPHPGGKHERLTTSSFHQDPASWSADGRYLTIVNIKGSRDFDILLYDFAVAEEPRPLVVTAARETCPMISPDGRWLVFESSQSERAEIYLQTFPAARSVHQVSASGGVGPRWSHDGRRIYFWTGIDSRADGHEAATIDAHDNLAWNLKVVGFTESDGEPILSPPRQLLSAAWVSHSSGRPNYELTADDRFLLLQSEPWRIRDIRVVTNWQENREPL